VLVFDRAGGGHVGFYVGEDLTSYDVLGGNQGDRVSIMRLEKSRCVARRWPIGRAVVGKPVMMEGDRNHSVVEQRSMTALQIRYG